MEPLSFSSYWLKEIFHEKYESYTTIKAKCFSVWCWLMFLQIINSVCNYKLSIALKKFCVYLSKDGSGF